MPINYRVWFIKRINKEFERANQKVSKAVHDNNPASNMMSGRSRMQSPARMRRFT